MADDYNFEGPPFLKCIDQNNTSTVMYVNTHTINWISWKKDQGVIVNFAAQQNAKLPGSWTKGTNTEEAIKQIGSIVDVTYLAG